MTMDSGLTKVNIGRGRQARLYRVTAKVMQNNGISPIRKGISVAKALGEDAANHLKAYEIIYNIHGRRYLDLGELDRWLVDEGEVLDFDYGKTGVEYLRREKIGREENEKDRLTVDSAKNIIAGRLLERSCLEYKYPNYSLEMRRLSNWVIEAMSNLMKGNFSEWNRIKEKVLDPAKIVVDLSGAYFNAEVKKVSSLPTELFTRGGGMYYFGKQSVNSVNFKHVILTGAECKKYKFVWTGD